MPTEWREGKEKFERGHVGDDQLLKGTQECDIFFKGTQVKAGLAHTAQRWRAPTPSSWRRAGRQWLPCAG